MLLWVCSIQLEYEDDWKDHLELYSNLDLANGEPSDYRSHMKVWNKFINKLKQIVSQFKCHCDPPLTRLVIQCGTAYNSHKFNIAWVMVGSAILNDQGLQESDETEGVKGVGIT